MRDALDKNELTSVEIIDQCMTQIQAHNTQGRNLRAIISTPSLAQLKAVAAALDNERKAGNIRSPLHGIPIVIKVLGRFTLPHQHLTHCSRIIS